MVNFLTLNPIAFKVGPLSVHWYGIFIALAIVLATYLAIREAKKKNISEDTIYDIILYSIPVAIISARIYYVVFQWSYYQYHLNEIIKVWDGGIAIYGGLIGAGFVIWYYCKRKNISIWDIFDIAAPTVILAQGIGRWGNFMNQEAFGAVTNLHFLQSLHLPDFIINQMLISGSYRQPTFLYESLWDILGFIILIAFRHRDHLFKKGEIFFSYIMWYSFGRFFIEGMRTDSLMLFDTIRVSQLLSVILFFVALISIFYRRKNKDLDWYYKK